ncbi:MAG: outer membrane beta-barrel protein [Chitinophagales bacterium]
MLKKYPYALLCLFLCISMHSSAQTNDTSAVFSLNGYVDTYIAWYTDSLAVEGYQQFPSTDPLSAQFGLNIAELSAAYDAKKVHANVTLHYGDLPMSAWSGKYNMIQQAYAGVKLGKSIWLDAGFFRTHIGGEGLYPKENIASSIAIPTYFEPYYESGLRMTWNINDAWELKVLAMNGYNMFDDNNRRKSAGILLVYTINDHWNAGYNNYYGDDTPEFADSILHNRLYNNLFVNFEKKKFKALLSADLAMQQNSGLDSPDASASMYSALLALRYQMCSTTGVYVRGSICNDPDGFMTGVYMHSDGTFSGLNITGATLGIEYKPIDNAYIRVEGRTLMAEDGLDIFYWNGTATASRMELLFNMGVWF